MLLNNTKLSILRRFGWYQGIQILDINVSMIEKLDEERKRKFYAAVEASELRCFASEQNKRRRTIKAVANLKCQPDKKHAFQCLIPTENKKMELNGLRVFKTFQLINPLQINTIQKPKSTTNFIHNLAKTLQEYRFDFKKPLFETKSPNSKLEQTQHLKNEVFSLHVQNFLLIF